MMDCEDKAKVRRKRYESWYRFCKDKWVSGRCCEEGATFSSRKARGRVNLCIKLTLLLDSTPFRWMKKMELDQGSDLGHIP